MGTRGFRRRPGRQRQNWKDVVKKDIRKKWASAGTRLKKLRRTGGAGGIVSPNASSTRDEPGTMVGLWLRLGWSSDTPRQWVRVTCTCYLYLWVCVTWHLFHSNEFVGSTALAEVFALLSSILVRIIVFTCAIPCLVK